GNGNCDRGARPAVPRPHRPLQAPARISFRRSAAEEQLREGAQDRIAPAVGGKERRRQRQTLTAGTRSSRRRFRKRISVTFKQAAMAPKTALLRTDPPAAGAPRLKLAFNLAQANKAHLTGAYALPEGNGAAYGPTGFGGVPGMSGFTEEPSP